MAKVGTTEKGKDQNIEELDFKDNTYTSNNSSKIVNFFKSTFLAVKLKSLMMMYEFLKLFTGFNITYSI